jgi:hypothetical protein
MWSDLSTPFPFNAVISVVFPENAVKQSNHKEPDLDLVLSQQRASYRAAGVSFSGIRTCYRSKVEWMQLPINLLYRECLFSGSPWLILGTHILRFQVGLLLLGS